MIFHRRRRGRKFNTAPGQYLETHQSELPDSGPANRRREIRHLAPIGCCSDVSANHRSIEFCAQSSGVEVPSSHTPRKRAGDRPAKPAPPGTLLHITRKSGGLAVEVEKSEERRVGKECRSRW